MPKYVGVSLGSGDNIMIASPSNTGHAGCSADIHVGRILFSNEHLYICVKDDSKTPAVRFRRVAIADY